MTDAARKYIHDYCTQNNLSINALEQKAGLKVDSAYAFLTERVADLKLSNAIKIADMMSVSLDELTGRRDFSKNFIKKTHKASPIKLDLFNSVIDFILLYIEKNKSFKYNFRQFTHAVFEIYEYYENKKVDESDKSFAEYFCKNQMHLFR